MRRLSPRLRRSLERQREQQMLDVIAEGTPAVKEKMLFGYPYARMNEYDDQIKVWIGNIDKGEGDFVSNFPIIAKQHDGEFDEKLFKYGFEMVYPGTVEFKNGFANVYIDKKYLVLVMRNI